MQRSGLERLPPGADAPTPLTELYSGRGEEGHRWPQVLPDGEHVLFTVVRGASFEEAALAVAPVDGGAPHRVVLEGASFGRYLPTGHLLFALDGSLLAAPFDIDRLEVTGPPVVVQEGVQVSADGVAQYATDGNSLLYAKGAVTGPGKRLVWVDREGNATPWEVPRRDYGSFALSPDGHRLAVCMAQGERDHDTWVADLERDTFTRLTTDPGDEFYPVWSPDGERIVFASNRLGPPAIFWVAADGSGQGGQFLDFEDPQGLQSAQFPYSFSPDGRLLAFVVNRPAGPTRHDVWVLPVDGGEPRPALGGPFDETHPMFSPDGKWLAYVSNESGQREVYVRPFPGPGTKHRVSIDGGDEPRWARSGNELYFRSGERMMVAEVSVSEYFRFGEPRELFSGQYVGGGSNPGTSRYEVTSDGQRFLLIEPEEEGGARSERLFLALNWRQELLRRMGGRG